MGKLYKRNGKYYADYSDSKGVRRRVSLKTGDRKVAKERLRKLELETTDRATHSTQTMSAALDHLTSVAMPAAGRAAGTIRCYETKARHIVRILGEETPINSLTRSMVQEFIGQRVKEEAASTTIHKEIVTLRQALKEAKERGVFSGDPVGVIPRFSAKYKPKDRHLSPAELESLLRELQPNRKLWVMICAFAGLRASEVEGLQWEHVDFGRGWIRVYGTKTAGSFRRVPILAQLRPWLEAFDANEGAIVTPWGNNRRDLHAACARAGIAKLSPNDLRRTFTSWMKQAGIDSLTVAQMLGHSSTRMVELVYGRLTEKTFQDAASVCAVFVTNNCANLPIPDEFDEGAEKAKTPQKALLGVSEGSKAVPGDRIELPTRGFSVPELKLVPARNQKKKTGSGT